jgi:hypothetical protein
MRMTIPRESVVLGDLDVLPDNEKAVLRDVLRTPTVCEVDKAEASGLTVVMVSELPCGQNPGMSITNAAETIATFVCRRFDIPHDKLIYLEHWPVNAYETGRKEQASFDMVVFRSQNGALHNPHWRPLTDDEKTLFLPLFDK